MCENIENRRGGLIFLLNQWINPLVNDIHTPIGTSSIMAKQFYFISILIFIISTVSFGQIVYTPPDDYVYDFLERLSLKGIIEYHDEVKPISRMEAAELLKKIEAKSDLLNDVEKKELDWYLDEYADELKIKNRERWYLFQYSDSLFNIKLFPLAGYEISTTGSNSGHSRWVGAGFFSTYSDWFGASMSITDKGEYGSNVDLVKDFSPETGAFFKRAPDGIEFSDVKGSLNFDFHWGSISLVKDYLEWGHGKFGQLIISQKSPSFPFIRLDLHPVDWLRFYYIHGWISSQVIDSSRTYYTNSGTLYPLQREVYFNKYIAANFLSITPTKIIDFSLGNSFIYSGDLRPEMFIPFMDFKFLDHNTGRGDVNDGNGQLYFDIAVKYPETFIFYSTLFIDCTEIRNVLKNDLSNTWYGFTFGGKKVDFFLPNLDLTVEYTKISPWVYEHKDQTTTYKNLNFYIGDWLGQNADQLRFQFDYQLIRGLRFNLYTEFIRKGGLKDIYYAYKTDITQPFLFHPLRKDFDFGFGASYEYVHDLYVKGSYKYSNISDDDLTRTPSFMLGRKNNFELTVYYGF